jgi:ABC-type antimicrobial peptide transport system permease subunit
LIGLLLAAIGTYGVVAHAVVRRSREIGIRMAIGATTGNVLRLVMRQGLVLVIVGVAIGFAGAWAASRALGSVLYSGGQNDILTFSSVPLVLVATAMLACWLPARRAANVDPMVALRQE